MIDISRDEHEQPIARLCHVCLYSLQGHAYPARCPECGTPEIAMQIRLSGLRAVGWWRICMLGLLTRFAMQNAWSLVMLPIYVRSAACRTASVFGLAVLACLMILFGSWVWSFGQMQTDQGWMERTWWYNGELSAERSTRVDDDLRSNRFRVTHHDRNGGQVILYFSDGRTHRQEVSFALLGDILRAAPTWLPHSTTRQGLRFAMTYIWGPATVAMTIVWLLVLGADPAIGLRRAVVVYLLFSCTLVPFLLTIFLMCIAKVGYITWLWNIELVEILAKINLATWYLVWFQYIRAGRACPCNRFRKAVFTAVGLLLSLLVLIPIIFAVCGEVGYTWI